MNIDKKKFIKTSNILRAIVIVYLLVLIGYSFVTNSIKAQVRPATVARVNTPTIIPTSTPEDMTNSFVDIQRHWAKDYFSLLLTKGVISGYPDNTLRPDKGISRAEAAVMVVKAADIRLSYSQLLDMNDEEQVKSWAKQFIITAVNNDVIKGYNDKTFRPDNKITRCEMIVMVLKAFGIEQSQDNTLAFADSSLIPQWSKGFVKKAVDIGIAKGYNDDNTFRPGKEINRAEAATIIAKCMTIRDK